MGVIVCREWGEEECSLLRCQLDSLSEWGGKVILGVCCLALRAVEVAGIGICVDDWEGMRWSSCHGCW